MDYAGAFFTVLGLAFILILAGAQAWYIALAGADDEAGLPRLLMRPLVVVAPGAGLYLLHARPDLALLALAIVFLPLALLGAGRLLVDRSWEKRERARLVSEIEAWERILEDNPDHGTARLVLGDRCRDLGEKDRAREFYRLAIDRSNDPERAKREIAELDRVVENPFTLAPEERREALRALARFPLYLALSVAGVFALLVLFVLFVYVIRRSPLWVSFMATILLPLYFLLRWLTK